MYLSKGESSKKLIKVIPTNLIANNTFTSQDLASLKLFNFLYNNQENKRPKAIQKIKYQTGYSNYPMV
jgi:hypothetical protein